MPLRGRWRIAAATAAAIATVLIGLRVNPPPSYEPDPPPHPALHEMIDDVRVDVSSLRRAVASIRAVTRTPIRFDRPGLDGLGWDEAADAPPEEWGRSASPPMRLRGMRLGAVLATAIQEIGDDLGTHVSSAGEIIVFHRGRSQFRDGERCLRVYDARDLATDCQEWGHRAPGEVVRLPDGRIDGVDALVRSLHERVAGLGFDAPDRGRIGRWGDLVWVPLIWCYPQRHRQVRVLSHWHSTFHGGRCASTGASG